MEDGEMESVKVGSFFQWLTNFLKLLSGNEKHHIHISEPDFMKWFYKNINDIADRFHKVEAEEIANGSNSTVMRLLGEFRDILSSRKSLGKGRIEKWINEVIVFNGQYNNYTFPLFDFAIWLKGRMKKKDK